MDEHPRDSIPAFVLGTLDVDEALLVSAHVARCAACYAEIEAFHLVLDALPYAATPQHPPAHVKQQLFARIAGSAPAFESAALAPVPSQHQPRWPVAIAAGAVALSLVFAMLMLNKLSTESTQNQLALAQLRSQLAQNQQTVVQLDDQHEQDQHAAMFIAAAKTRHRTLNSVDQHASATMYMQPGNPQAVLVIEGMAALAPGQTYQFWLADAHGSIACRTFDVTPEGQAVLMIKAPAPVSQYDQAMVTVEPSGGATTPSDKIVLSGSLSAGQPVIVALGEL